MPDIADYCFNKRRDYRNIFYSLVYCVEICRCIHFYNLGMQSTRASGMFSTIFLTTDFDWNLTALVVALQLL